MAQNLFSCYSCPFLLYTLIDTNENHFSYAGGRRADISMMHEKLIIFRKHLIKKTVLCHSFVKHWLLFYVSSSQRNFDINFVTCSINPRIIFFHCLFLFMTSLKVKFVTFVNSFGIVIRCIQDRVDTTTQFVMFHFAQHPYTSMR